MFSLYLYGGGLTSHGGDITRYDLSHIIGVIPHGGDLSSR